VAAAAAATVAAATVAAAAAAAAAATGSRTNVIWQSNAHLTAKGNCTKWLAIAGGIAYTSIRKGTFSGKTAV